jgi:hypothetical protein
MSLISAPGNGWFEAEARRSGTLYLAAVVVTRYNNPAIKIVYRRLYGVGKAKKVASIACMWKLLTMRVPMVPELDRAFAIEQICLGDTPISSVFPMIDAVR